MATTVKPLCGVVCKYYDYNYKYDDSFPIDRDALVISMVVVAIISLIAIIAVLVHLQRDTRAFFRCCQKE